ncbi:unnamed protein product [Ilex paraguariensis]|uniref:Apple domain-containing protein n=1 Tax=Ilex paraguariensis TaxID=185542 RepID=A0ABC8V0B8_9AQUA
MARVDKSMGLKACEELCFRNCSCTGYTSADVNGTGRGCITWDGELIDTSLFLHGGQDLYIRVDAAELAQYSKKSKSFDHKRLVTIVASIAAMLFILPLVYWLAMKRRKGKTGRNKLPIRCTSSPFYQVPSRGNEINESGTNSDLQFFDLSTIVAATDFSLINKLGQGGFGMVYKVVNACLSIPLSGHA